MRTNDLRADCFLVWVACGLFVWCNRAAAETGQTTGWSFE
jgi:hypothetical protein